MMNLAMGALFGFLVGLAMNQSPAKPTEDEEYFRGHEAMGSPHTLGCQVER